MCFHSTKEGFKEVGKWDFEAWTSYVSIPPRKVSRGLKRFFRDSKIYSFHSTKEGFKGGGPGAEKGGDCRFPFHQGRFQGAPT